MSRASIHMRLGTTLLTALVVGACDTSEPDCAGDTVACSDDGLSIVACRDGHRAVTECMREHGQLCEMRAADGAGASAACVDPWRYGAPRFDACEGASRATQETLAEKARYFEEITGRLHLHPDLGWIMGVRLAAGATESTASFRDVEAWQSEENDGLWSSLYMAAEAYRFGATKDPEALERLRVLLASEARRMRITGVPGIFTRQMHPPNIAGLECPTELAAYVPSADKTDNKWVRIEPGGCIQVVDPSTMTWKTTDKCGLGEFAGWCFLDNVSQDEYAGHVFALAAVAKLVDDASVADVARDLLSRVGHHLVEHELALVDWDGRVTEHGKLWAYDLLSGFSAAMSASFLKVAADATSDATLRDFYERCLMTEESGCIHRPGAASSAYVDLARRASLDLGCLTNWNGLSMHMLSLHDLLWYEHEPARRAVLTEALRDDMWSVAASKRPLSAQNNPWFDFMWAADKALGVASDGPAYDAVKNGVCMLRQFPAHKTQPERDCAGCVETCKDRLGGPMTEVALEAADRCWSSFVWWRSPYGIERCTADDRVVYAPTDYLLPYWMGRYYGFIAPEW